MSMFCDRENADEREDNFAADIGRIADALENLVNHLKKAHTEPVTLEGPASQPVSVEIVKPKRGRPAKVTTPVKPAAEPAPSKPLTEITAPTLEDMRKALTAFAVRKGSAATPDLVEARKLLQRVAEVYLLKDCPTEKYAAVIAEAEKAK